VGAYLARDILAKGWSLVATGSTVESSLPFGEDPLFHYDKMELTNEDSIKAVCVKHLPDIIIHSGAMSRPDECELKKDLAFATNVTSTIALLEQAEKAKSFFIFLSTDFVFDGKKGNYSESDEPSPVNYYGQTKLAAEKAVMQYRFSWAIVRTILVYGRPLLTRPYLLSIVEEKLRSGQPYKVVNDQRRTPTYVEDLCSGIISIVERKASGIFHLSGEDLLTPYQMAVKTAAFLRLDSSLIEPVTADSFSQPAKRPAFTSFNLARSKKELNYQPHSFEEALKKTLGSC
jgi:dTDP-4-dehydrorhamnose reductase